MASAIGVAAAMPAASGFGCIWKATDYHVSVPRLNGP